MRGAISKKTMLNGQVRRPFCVVQATAMCRCSWGWASRGVRRSLRPSRGSRCRRSVDGLSSRMTSRRMTSRERVQHGQQAQGGDLQAQGAGGVVPRANPDVSALLLAQWQALHRGVEVKVYGGGRGGCAVHLRGGLHARGSAGALLLGSFGYHYYTLLEVQALHPDVTILAYFERAYLGDSMTPTISKYRPRGWRRCARARSRHAAADGGGVQRVEAAGPES